MLSENLTKLFGAKLYQKAVEFPKNKVKIIAIREKPIKVRSIILDHVREFHLVINEKRFEIFHDCPSFLIHTERRDKMCIHIVTLLTFLEEELASKIIENLDSYVLTSEDFGSKRKRKNFLILANSCLETNNCVEGLNYLNKAIINQKDCETIIERYLLTSIENNLYIEFFEFLQSSFENELENYLLKFNKLIEKGIKRFLPAIPHYTFFEILRILESVDKFLEHTRIFRFCNNEDEIFYISSADWMPRNIDRRIEVTCPVYDEDIKDELRTYMDIQWRDNVRARILDEKLDNRYRRDRSSKKIRTQWQTYDYLKKYHSSSGDS